jgi:disulfide bond formation protein DsbB
MMARLYVLANAANAWVLMLILAGGFIVQLIANEPPCPLCVMQRITMLLAALGPCYVLLRAARGPLEERDVAIGCGMLISASLVGAAIAIRQILLHILPNDPGFGTPLFGYHLYTWALIAFALNILAGSLQLIGLDWFSVAAVRAKILARATAVFVAAMLAANILSVVAEAGLAWKLPDNPTDYLLFQHG